MTSNFFFFGGLAGGYGIVDWVHKERKKNSQIEYIIDEFFYYI